MSAIEFFAQVNKTFTLQQYEPINNVELDTPLAVTEVSPGRYRATSARVGIVYCVASATNLSVVGYANLSKPGPNAFSELLDSYDEAYALGFTPDLPPPEDLQPSDVRAGVSWTDSEGNVQTGTLVLPEENQVLEDVGFGDLGTEFIGTLVVSASESDGMITADGQIKSPLWIGTDYLISAGNGLIWRVKAPTGLDPLTTPVYFRARKACSKSSAYAWDVAAASVTAVSVSGVPHWDIGVNLLAEDTTALTEGIYRWWLVAETLTADLVLKEYNSYPPLRLARA